MADLYAGSNCLNIKCTRKHCRTAGIIIVLAMLTKGVSLIPLIIPLSFSRGGGGWALKGI